MVMFWLLLNSVCVVFFTLFVILLAPRVLARGMEGFVR